MFRDCYTHRSRLFPALCLLVSTVPALASGQAASVKSPAPTTADFRKGVLYGKVLDEATGKPIPDATVALQDPKGKVLAWSKTNAQGEYALAADPMTALELRPSRRRGLLEEVCRTVGDVITAPVKVAGAAVANPGKTLTSVAVSVASGTPAPIAAQVVAPALTDPKQAVAETQQQAKVAAVQTAVGQGPKGKQEPRECGEARLAVSAPNYKDLQGKAGAYWMDAPKTEGNAPIGLQTWLETAKLAPDNSDKKSDIAQEALLLSDPQVEPTLAPAGATIKIRARLQDPSGTSHSVRLFAREAHKDVVAELKPGTGANSSVFEGTMTLDPKTPAGETAITIAALRAEPVEVKLNPKKADPLMEFVRRLDDMQAAKPYQYDPRIMASENRLDVKLTILDPKQGTQTPAATPAAPGTKPPGKP